jgi:hypothetical protein
VLGLCIGGGLSRKKDPSEPWDDCTEPSLTTMGELAGAWRSAKLFVDGSSGSRAG